MDDVDELLGLARGLADEIVGLAAGLLSAGIDVEYVHGRYVIVASSFSATLRHRVCSPPVASRLRSKSLRGVVRVLADLRDEARAEADPSRG